MCEAGSSWNAWALMKTGSMDHNLRKLNIPKGSVCASFPGKREVSTSTRDQTADLQESQTKTWNMGSSSDDWVGSRLNAWGELFEQKVEQNVTRARCWEGAGHYTMDGQAWEVLNKSGFCGWKRGAMSTQRQRTKMCRSTYVFPSKRAKNRFFRA